MPKGGKAIRWHKIQFYQAQSHCHHHHGNRRMIRGQSSKMQSNWSMPIWAMLENDNALSWHSLTGHWPRKHGQILWQGGRWMQGRMQKAKLFWQPSTFRPSTRIVRINIIYQALETGICQLANDWKSVTLSQRRCTKMATPTISIYNSLSKKWYKTNWNISYLVG